MVLETAVNGRADLLVTFNQKDFVAAAKGFAHIHCVLPRRSIDYVEKRNGENAEQGYETK
jgi:hypothetical protein